jgi:hypothetical protein
VPISLYRVAEFLEEADVPACVVTRDGLEVIAVYRSWDDNDNRPDRYKYIVFPESQASSPETWTYRVFLSTGLELPPVTATTRLFSASFVEDVFDHVMGLLGRNGSFSGGEDDELLHESPLPVVHGRGGGYFSLGSSLQTPPLNPVSTDFRGLYDQQPVLAEGTRVLLLPSPRDGIYLTEVGTVEGIDEDEVNPGEGRNAIVRVDVNFRGKDDDGLREVFFDAATLARTKILDF